MKPKTKKTQRNRSFRLETRKQSLELCLSHEESSCRPALSRMRSPSEGVDSYNSMVNAMKQHTKYESSKGEGTELTASDMIAPEGKGKRLRRVAPNHPYVSWSFWKSCFFLVSFYLLVFARLWVQHYYGNMNLKFWLIFIASESFESRHRENLVTSSTLVVKR